MPSTGVCPVRRAEPGRTAGVQDRWRGPRDRPQHRAGALQAYLAEEITEDEVVRRIGANYLHYVKAYEGV
jgi:hypothetical protein